MQKTVPFWDVDQPSDEEGTEGLEPTKTVDGVLLPRKTFSFLCPTSIECPDAGCCPVGTWCTIVEGQFGCCDLPIDVCCDDWNGPDPNGLQQGQVTCAPNPDVSDINADWDDHIPGFRCQFSALSGAQTPTPLPCPGTLTRCGGECCPSSFICNKQIPGLEFCDPPQDLNIAAGVTAVSQLGFGRQEFNTSAGAAPTSLGSGRLYTATEAVMNGTAVSVSQNAVTKSFTSGVGGSATGSASVSASTSKAGAEAGVLGGWKVVVVEAVVAVGGVVAVVAL
ncbi:hypothetical protein MMC30_009231 [Trapelia coarctata]|nr:hypothetical protein [Trapelia coarctata]